jgi:hypothetical protein
MVETEGTKLPTPHPVIEPVSGTRVRNGNFQCRDGSVKAAVPPLRDRYRDAQRSEKPPFWRDYREKTERSSIPMTGWWRWYGSNWLPPTQSYRTASLPPALIAAISLSLRAACGSATRPERAPSAATWGRCCRPAGIAPLVRMNRPVDPAL